MDYNISLYLNTNEISVLNLQDDLTAKAGGFQSHMVKLKKLVNQVTGEILLTRELLRIIQKYAFMYGNGGWESRLLRIFGRILGKNLNTLI